MNTLRSWILACAGGALVAGAAFGEREDSPAAADSSGAPPPEASAPPAAVFAALARGYGGTEALEAFRGFRAQGSIMTVEDGRGGRIDVSLLLDESMRVESRLPEKIETRILAGALAWSGGGKHQKPARRDVQDGIRLQYHALAAPFVLTREDRAALRPIEASPEGWTRLERAWRDDLAMVYDIDEETGLVRRTTGRSREGEGARTIVTEMSDYRAVETENGAVMLPFRMTTRIGERLVSETRWERIESRDAFPAETFLPDGTAADF